MKKTQIYTSLIVISLLVSPFIAQAAISGVDDLIGVVCKVVNYFAVIVGALAVLMFLYAGLMWMTAAGDEEKIGTAKKFLIYASIGMIIFILAYSAPGILANFLGESDGAASTVGTECSGFNVVFPD